MTCPEFLDRYTDFRDGLITAPRELRRFGRHLVQCASCRRYDAAVRRGVLALQAGDRKSTRLNSSHLVISYAVFCLKKKKIYNKQNIDTDTDHDNSINTN